MVETSLFFDDVIFQLQKTGGISNYWRNVTESPLMKSQFGVARGGQGDFLHSKVKRQVVKCQPAQLPTNFDGIFHSSYYRLPDIKCRSVVTVHDFIYQKFGSGISRFLNQRLIARAIKSAEAIICISHATKNDLLHIYDGINENNVHVVHHGVDSEIFNQDSAQDVGISGVASDYVLFVGARGGYKNFKVAANAVKVHGDLQLVIVGAPLSPDERWFLDKSRVSFSELGYVTDSQLAVLYRSAVCFLYPSLYEGFGMPILEAMACGTPVITSDHQAVREVGGSASLFGNGVQIDSYVEALAEAISNRSRLSEAGVLHAKRFTWEGAIKKTLAVYEVI